MPAPGLWISEKRDSQTVTQREGGEWAQLEQTFLLSVGPPTATDPPYVGATHLGTYNPAGLETIHALLGEYGLYIDALMPATTGTIPGVFDWQGTTPTEEYRPRLAQLRVEAEPLAKEHWNLTVIWQTLWPLSISSNGAYDGVPGVRVTMGSGIRTTNVWKLGTLWVSATGVASDFIPANGKDTDASSVNIEVDAATTANVVSVDDSGAPQRIPVPTQSFNVLLPYPMAPDPLAAGGRVNYPCWRNLADLQGARNSAAFLEFPAGSLLWEGIDFRQVSTAWATLSVRFSFDRWSHLQQRPQRLLNGQVDIESGTVLGVTRNFARNVYWFQAFPDTFDFNDVWQDPWMSESAESILALINKQAACGTGGIPA